MKQRRDYTEVRFLAAQDLVAALLVVVEARVLEDSVAV
jgi:hypothetical protein